MATGPSVGQMTHIEPIPIGRSMKHRKRSIFRIQLNFEDEGWLFPNFRLLIYLQVISPIIAYAFPVWFDI